MQQTVMHDSIGKIEYNENFLISVCMLGVTFLICYLIGQAILSAFA